MKIDFTNATFKDFEDPAGYNAFQRAAYFNEFLNYLDAEGRLNYRFETCSASGPEVELNIPSLGGIGKYVSLVSNDYLGFSQHPLVKKAAIFGIENYGTGTGASPAIGGHFDFHRELEEKISENGIYQNYEMGYKIPLKSRNNLEIFIKGYGTHDANVVTGLRYSFGLGKK